MIQTELYKRRCSRCKKKTLHRICNINLRKGVRIRCTECSKFLNKWINIKELKGGNGR